MNILTTKDGNKTVTINSVNIHSKYSPIKEAKKFISQSIKKDEGTVIVIGAGLGYLLTEIDNSYPKLKIVNIPLNSDLEKLSREINPIKCQTWDMNSDITEFIKLNITEETITNLQIIFWQPLVNQYPDLFNKISEVISKRVRFLNGNIITTARFGRLWIKNALRNFISIDTYVKEIKIANPIIITASGPSLEKSLDVLKKYRDQMTIFALSSSLLALRENEIEPDLVFSTDPGYYSKLHIYGNNKTVAMPLSNSTSASAPVLLLNQGNVFEEELISTLNLPNIRVKENGTVAGTALDFALQFNNNPVYLLGQDLESNNIKSHVTPYAFDNLLKAGENRTSSYYDIMYKRWITTGVNYKTYRDWFINIGKNNPGRIIRVSPFGKKIENINDIDIDNFINCINGDYSPSEFVYTQVINRKERLGIVKKLLKKWLNGVSNEKTGLKGLINLISPMSSTDGISKSKKFLEDLLILYGRELL